MPEMKSGFVKNSQRGQIIAVVPFVVLFMLGSIMLMVAVAQMCRERMQVQIAADAAARSGALVQAMGIEAIGNLNVEMEYTGVSQIEAGIAMEADPFEWVKAWRTIRSGVKTIHALQQCQRGVMDGTIGLVEEVVLGVGHDNGVTAIAVPSPLNIELGSSWSDTEALTAEFFFGTEAAVAIIFAERSPYATRKSNDVAEIVDVVATQKGSRIFGAKFLGGAHGTVSPPRYTALSSARPYFFGSGHDPYQDRLSNKEALSSMRMVRFIWNIPTYPGAEWDAKLCPTALP